MYSEFGNIINQEVKISGLTQKQFAEKLNMSVRNIQNLFEREDYNIVQLMQISTILKKDFVTKFVELKKNDLKFQVENGNDSTLEENLKHYFEIKNQENSQINIQINLKGNFEDVSKHLPNLLLKIKNEATQYGITIS